MPDKLMRTFFLFQASQLHSIGYSNWINGSMFIFPDQSFTAFIMLSFYSYNSSTLPMLHLSLSLSFPFINTTSIIAIFICLCLFFILSFSLRERKYSLFYLFQATFLKILIYLCRFLITLSSSSSNCFSGIVIRCLCIRMFGVNTGN